MLAYPQRIIGDDRVSAQGLGCMGMSQAYTSFGGYDDKESLATLTAAADFRAISVCARTVNAVMTCVTVHPFSLQSPWSSADISFESGSTREVSPAVPVDRVG